MAAFRIPESPPFPVWRALLCNPMTKRRRERGVWSFDRPPNINLIAQLGPIYGKKTPITLISRVNRWVSCSREMSFDLARRLSSGLMGLMLGKKTPIAAISWFNRLVYGGRGRIVDHLADLSGVNGLDALASLPQTRRDG